MDELKIKLVMVIAGSSCFWMALKYMLKYGDYNIRISFRSKKNK